MTLLSNVKEYAGGFFAEVGHAEKGQAASQLLPADRAIEWAAGFWPQADEAPAVDGHRTRVAVNQAPSHDDAAGAAFPRKQETTLRSPLVPPCVEKEIGSLRQLPR